MPSIHPSAPGCHGDSRARIPDNSSKLSSARTLAYVRTRGWKKLLPQPDIAGCIAFSKLRCIITLVSLALLATDIPRTGLGVLNLQEYYPVPLMPSTAVRFGPFNYPVLHIWRLDNGTGDNDAKLAGLKGTQSISAARVWSYQYDTTSVGLRGAVELLNVTEFPSFLIYKSQPDQPRRNVNSLLEFGTAFTMLDAFITAAHTQLMNDDNSSATLRFATLHNWVDRLHQYVLRSVTKNPAWRLHSLHVRRISTKAQSLAICAPAGIAERSWPRPRFCNHPGIWKCRNPMNDSLPVVRLRDHIDLRLRSLQQRYPDLELDVALLSSQRLSSTSGAMRSTFYNYEALEIVTLTRGRRCVEKTTNSSSVTTCSTVFVDDYRYERDIVQTSLVDWYGIIAMLRGGAQTYVWIRLLLLVYGAYTASGQSAAEKLNSSSRFASTALIVFKIPFQVIVYSSLLPVSAYVGALILDSSFTDIFLDSYWASVGGAVNFKLVPFIRTTSVEMRGVWSLALFASVVLFAMRRSRYYDEGISGIRGLLISFTSSLTVFGPYKSIRYRDMDIVSVFQMPDGGQTMDIVQSSNPAGCYNISSYIYGGSSKTVRLCLVAVAAFALIFKALGYLTPRRTWTYRATRGMIFRTSNVAPCGTESLWKTTSPMIHFSVPTRPQQSRNTTSTSELNSAHTSPMKSHTTGFSTPRVAPLSLLNLSIAGLSHRRMSTDPPPLRQPRRYPWIFCSEKRDSAAPESIESSTGGLGSRTIAAHSILQLMNIAMMTDPWNFFWLRVIGIPLYLYHVRPTPSTGNSSSVLPYAVILPYAEDEMEERTGLSCEDFDLLDSASSRDVPMSVLLQCG